MSRKKNKMFYCFFGCVERPDAVSLGSNPADVFGGVWQYKVGERVDLWVITQIVSSVLDVLCGLIQYHSGLILLTCLAASSMTEARPDAVTKSASGWTCGSNKIFFLFLLLDVVGGKQYN
jgi:hypothetical protein